MERVNGLHLKQYFQPQTVEASPDKTASSNSTQVSETSWMDAQDDGGGIIAASPHADYENSSANKAFLEPSKIIDQVIAVLFILPYCICLYWFFRTQIFQKM